MAVEPISDMLNEFVDAWLEEEGGAHETWEALTATSSRCSRTPSTQASIRMAKAMNGVDRELLISAVRELR